MSITTKFPLMIVFLSFLFSIETSVAGENKVRELETGIKSDFYISDAAFFKAESKDKAVVFVPGFIFNKESWKSLAESFQKSGIAALTVNGKSVQVVKEAVDYLQKKDFKEIVLVGGSSGAAAILAAYPELSGISKVVLLSPPHGTAIADDKVNKLFVTSIDERLFPTVQSIYESTSFPKTIKIFDGNAHAQFIFYGAAGAELTALIQGFVNQ